MGRAYDPYREVIESTSTAKFRIRFLSSGFRQILTSDACKNLVEEQTEKIADKANSGQAEFAGYDNFSSNVSMSDYAGGRWMGKVKTATKFGRIEEAEHKTLSKAVM